MTIIKISNYTPSNKDIFIFDSNIWVYLFDKTFLPEYYIAKSIDIYAEFYKKILIAKSKVLISSFNIHEISKKFINNDKKSLDANNNLLDYKNNYRNSRAYENVLNHIKSVNKEIFKFAEPINDVFDEFENSRFFNTNIDFIDEYLSFLTAKYKCKLITHDKDFKNCPFDIEILTDNNKLIYT